MQWSKIKHRIEYRSLAAAALFVLLFTIFTGWMAYAHGIGFALPNLRIFIIIGMHSWIPIICTLCVYLIYQAMMGRLFDRQLFERVAIDIAYILLLSFAFYLHFHLKAWVPVINPLLHDDVLWRTDLALDSITQKTQIIRAFFADLPFVDKFYQLGYIILVLSSFLLIAYTNRAVFRHFILALLLTIILGTLGYLAYPALGPFIFEVGLNVEAVQAQKDLLEWHVVLREKGVSWLNEQMPNYFGASLAAMPSLHVAYSFLVTYAMWRCYPYLWVRGVFVVFLVLVICESVWSKWHYWIDAPVGIAIALASLYLVPKIAGENYGKNQSSKSDC